MNKHFKNIICFGLIMTMLFVLSACGKQEYINVEETTKQEEYALQPVENYDTKEIYEYTDEGIKQKVEETFESKDGLCKILVYPDYYDVTLDYEKGTPSQVAKAYAETILEVNPSYADIIEPYIYENIKGAFSGHISNYHVLEDRMNVLFDSIPEEYREEIKAFASTISKGEKGFVENGKISYEEAIIVQMVPDALRPTSCSALSLWGNKTTTGEGITLRSLEWNLGSEFQIGNVNAVVHMVKGDRSITTISMLGLLDVISGINNDGVFVGILDVGASEYPFVYEGKRCYTFDIRYALEEFDNATDVGNYMVDNSGNYTWCHNLIITDADNSYCAEDCVADVYEGGDGYSILRDADTPILEGLNWESEDSLCVLNSFMAEGNLDIFTGSLGNMVRFEKYNRWVKEIDKFSVKDVKDMITQESTAQYDVVNVHSNYTAHLVLVDYSTGNIQVAFTGSSGVVDKPLFLDVGNY